MNKQIIDTLIKFGLITNIGVDANAYKDVDDLINKGVVTIPGAKSKIDELLKNIKIEVVDEQEVKVTEPLQEVKTIEPAQEVKVTEPEKEIKVTEPEKEIEVIVEEATEAKDVTVSTTKNTKKQNKTK